MKRCGFGRRWLGLAVVGLVVTATTAWAADTIVLGTAISQTGKYAREGKFYVDAYQMTVDAINKAGGVKVGGKTYTLELKMYDDQSDPNLCVRLFTRLVTSDKVNFLLDATLGMISIQQNSIIKIFSVAAVVFLPPTLIASIYGMNFHFIPELSWEVGYPLALGMMVVSAVLPYLYFKRKGWL